MIEPEIDGESSEPPAVEPEPAPLVMDQWFEVRDGATGRYLGLLDSMLVLWWEWLPCRRDGATYRITHRVAGQVRGRWIATCRSGHAPTMRAVVTFGRIAKGKGGV